MTDYQFNNPTRKKLRQKLRKEAPKAEGILWSELRGRQLNNLKFRRQYGIGPYIVDFYCPKLRLAIEVDGESHFGEEAKIYDKNRQQMIERYNINFLRFSNDEIYSNLEGVLQAIWNWAD